MKKLDLVGQRFGLLEVISEHGKPNPYRQFLCHCECGNKCVKAGSQLKRGKVNSCGCMRYKGAPPKHGMSHSPEYASWSGARDRCANLNDPDYGGRGIRVCERWSKFENFFADMGPRPSPEHSLDRYPDTDGNYEPTNCRWATREEQQRNKRDNRLLTYRGITATVTEWAERTGINRMRLFNRLHNGWSVERTLTEPVRERRRPNVRA